MSNMKKLAKDAIAMFVISVVMLVMVACLLTPDTVGFVP